MRRITIILVLAFAGASIAAWGLFGKNQNETTANQNRSESKQQVAQSEPPPKEKAKHVPAHYKSEPTISSLGPALSPELFTGQTQAAYKAVEEIPQIIAQLPCYCHCDKSIGHKSLYSCFEDNHAAQCAVCVGEALTALKLHKEQRLAAPEIRERVIAEYSKL